MGWGEAGRLGRGREAGMMVNACLASIRTFRICSITRSGVKKASVGFAEKAQGLRVLPVLAKDLNAVPSFCNGCEGACLHKWMTQEARD